MSDSPTLIDSVIQFELNRRVNFFLKKFNKRLEA